MPDVSLGVTGVQRLGARSDGSGARVELVERWGPEGIERLRELYDPLRRFAAVIGGFDVDPDDLVQGAYANVLTRDPELIRDLGPYLRRVIANLATDERRRAARTNGVLRRIDPATSRADSYPSDLADLLRVPAKTRALLYLVDVEGHGVADAAALVGLSGGAARVALMRARRRLRTELDTEANGE